VRGQPPPRRAPTLIPGPAYPPPRPAAPLTTRVTSHGFRNNNAAPYAVFTTQAQSAPTALVNTTLPTACVTHPVRGLPPSAVLFGERSVPGAGTDNELKMEMFVKEEPNNKVVVGNLHKGSFMSRPRVKEECKLERRSSRQCSSRCSTQVK